jgi:hypothetical protein
MDICAFLARDPEPGSLDPFGAGPLVSVVVPAFNAEATLRRSLCSIAAQDYPTLEILIVDDGSTDSTAAVAERFCVAEPRARLLRKDNGGVASARNHGLAHASGDFIAPVDSDDLWHPGKISRQMRAALSAAEPPGFVYCWFRDIDEAGRVWRDGPPLSAEGPALQRLACFNFVGNGSTPLFSRRALLAVGGYDERLRELGAEGCEDLLVQLRVAQHFPVAVVPEYLVGYRLSPGSMSSDPDRMFRSWQKALDLLGGRDGLSPRALRWSEGARALLLSETRALRGETGPALRLLGRAFRRDPVRTGLHVLSRAARRLGRTVGAPKALPSFEAHEATAPSTVTDPWLRALARFDQRRLDRIERLERPGPPPGAAGP